MRLITRGDLDGLTCAVLISIHEHIEDILLVHPQDLTEERIEILPTDILANVPYQAGCAMWFDHHQHTATVAAPVQNFRGRFGQAPSAARLVYEYYGGEQKMPHFADLVSETDRLDSANLTPDDVMRPQGFIKLGFTLDSRSGLGTFKSYFINLVNLLRRNTPVEQLLTQPEVAERCRRLEQADSHFCGMLSDHSYLVANIIITDFRELDPVPIGNRFLVYALFPEVNVSARIQWNASKSHLKMSLGHSIFNRSCQTNVGELAARYGGGGHQGAGSIPLMDQPDQQIQLIIAELKAKG